MVQVSIIIPHFNRLQFLERTIDSVKNETLKEWEIVIVDDRSEKDVWEYLQRLEAENIRIYRRPGERKKGPSACRNIGAKKAEGEYLIFLDSDDILAPFCLEQRIKAMEENPGVDAGVFLMEEFDKQPGDVKKIFNNQVSGKKWTSAFLRNENPWNVTCPIWKRDAFEKTGGFNENFLYMEDSELHLRAIQKDIRFKTFYNLPADCYYRINHMDETKSDFYYNSIFYRILFYKLASEVCPETLAGKHPGDIKAGINNCIRTFLYSRKDQFPELYENFIKMMQQAGIYSRFEIWRYRRLIEWGNTGNIFLKKLRIKGLCFRLLSFRPLLIGLVGETITYYFI